MPTVKKTVPSATKVPAAKAPAKTKVSSKDLAAPTPTAKRKLPATAVARPAESNKASPATKATARKKTASVSVSRTSNPRTNTTTIKKITRNIVGFYMTEDIEIRRVTKSDNMSKEKLKAKYADLKAKVKSR